ncbi:hypothetical protein DUI87_00842 [Hirundo rustica rustica]|uniref:Core shell protein Gag P30 domain-containing protein n=1 Tax=Hirundo rustica rustica TaxID=333673 RepID=A0A3M0L4G3_HIRRU|nr:hypothetical protein DUI87_00842 [Hirundo rustica rustica]
MSSSTRGGTVKPQQSQRASGTPSGAPSSSETATLHRFFPVSYKKSTSPPEQQFKQKQSEPLSTVRDDGAAQEEHQDMSITDDNIIHITASEGIPVRTTKTFDFSCHAPSLLLSKDFMKQFFRQFREAASEFHQDSFSSLPRLLLEKGVAEKLRDAQQSLVPVPQAKEKETKQDEVKPQKQADPGKDEAALKLQTQQSIPVSDKTQISGARVFSAADWTEIRKKVLKGETLKMMGSSSVAMPVTYDAQDANPRWERLDHEVIKDLMKAICDNGLGSPYFKQLLKGTFNIYDLTTFDLKSLASMILTDSQFIIWKAKWRRALDELRDKYQGGTNAGFTIAQLAGDLPLDNPARQVRLFPREVLTDIKNAAQKAMVQIPPTGVTENIYRHKARSFRIFHLIHRSSHASSGQANQ